MGWAADVLFGIEDAVRVSKQSWKAGWVARFGVPRLDLVHLPSLTAEAYPPARSTAAVRLREIRALRPQTSTTATA